MWLAAAVANPAKGAAGNTFTRILAKANGRRWDSGVILIPVACLTDYCCVLLRRECPLNATWGQSPLRLITLHLLLRQLANWCLLRAIAQAYFEKPLSCNFVSNLRNFSKVVSLLRRRQWKIKCFRVFLNHTGHSVTLHHALHRPPVVPRRQPLVKSPKTVGQCKAGVRASGREFVALLDKESPRNQSDPKSYKN